jgi:hypothetical protein
MSGALDHDFEMVLPDNVRGGNRGDVAKIASLRGIYLANAFSYGSDDMITHITFSNGATWDYVAIPADLVSTCNSTFLSWCDMHFVGRSTRNIAEPPYSPAGAVGIAMATGNVGSRVMTDSPDELSTFLTRDGGVTWKQIADGNNLYAIADRGAVLLWAGARQSVSNITYSWDEGVSSGNCALGLLGRHTIHSVTSSPSRDGLRVHLLTENGGKNYIVTVDFSSLSDSKCNGEATPNIPTSDYETWTPKTPEGEQGCLLGARVTYVRRKPGNKCFNVDADLVLFFLFFFLSFFLDVFFCFRQQSLPTARVSAKTMSATTAMREFSSGILQVLVFVRLAFATML